MPRAGVGGNPPSLLSLRLEARRARRARRFTPGPRTAPRGPLPPTWSACARPTPSLRARDTTIEAATRSDLEAFLADVLARRTASTRRPNYKPLKLLYAWLAEEEEISADPMRRMKRPIVSTSRCRSCRRRAQAAVSCLRRQHLRGVPRHRVDHAADTGARRDEMAGLNAHGLSRSSHFVGASRPACSGPGRAAGAANDRQQGVDRSDHPPAPFASHGAAGSAWRWVRPPVAGSRTHLPQC